ncbi:MAG: TetR/AcrR family transcriptional regulator [Pseudodesulfovibrio sp.]|jgi:AcrR family transcriptional regulator|uniref:TetR family transcriptional regulator n=1 Tax=Pseudodesulfovibrio indicus TaxID=1716143 RepID=A0A126QLQ4_9BACT|nr:TetR/AcrR family transcriptional regulator [Pseudodesulfovibrio indicus]AMK10726.1 TetR family transcriptional regulator [Pseudodesulfovibrio indicus]TDT91711.1 TetR family transcriptional regulator [Pseudodesulfovibrio indicus]
MTKKEAILSAAQEAFGQLGFHAATVKDVAGRADVSFGLVSHYFGSKQELFLAAGFDMADRLIARLGEATADAENGLEAIRAYMTAYFDFTEQHRTGFPVLLRCSPFSHMEPGVDGAKVAEKFSVFIDLLKRCVSKGIEDGSIRSLPTEQTALIIYGNIVGSVRTSLLSPYESDNLFAETINHVERSLTHSPGTGGC